MISLKTNKSQLLTTSVENKIINLIKENDMKPGEKLKNEYELAKLLNVSRTTVREAIKALVSRNILTVKQGAGTFVSSKNGIPHDPLGITFMNDTKNLAFDLLNIRLILEPEIASLAAINGTKKQKEELLNQCTIIENLIQENKDYSKEDILFHSCIAKCSGNKVVENLVPIINSSILLTIDVTKNIYQKDTIKEHRAITEAIIKGDYLGAKTAMIVHLHTNRLGIKKIIENI
ncbi:putative L-lactate dehydrogenase operon regulatory protein [Fusobacterium sp. DD29]|nr:putative L-lactate dehydrogenase operon regulatory protein [Fusobacterium sp. DD29]MBR8761759.1 putative L-lactate dehydrogenase operon regulatory protein [Fusobacterium sp. DD25]MBR8767777.1 putative L-lactate dehydrogenase operon regulatory protein [Fusobacterium sp. DD43]MBR8771802.1 putative L-lactate dehydrogenase operon regulatory protein [Fusobacterium sp. DD40]MBR8776053.1 putative L-lactate dehydrogenase operon regulatory protein [Fusobacterium sp. DD17]MBR8798317.1 putative L-lact